MNHFGPEYSSIFAWIYAAIKLLLIGFIMRSSSFWHNARFVAAFVLGFALVGVGALFKVTHWPLADGLLLTGTLLALTAYILWFSAKKAVFLLGYLKLAWVVGMSCVIVALVLYSPALRPVVSITEAIFWAMVLFFAYRRWVRRPGPLRD